MTEGLPALGSLWETLLGLEFMQRAYLAGMAAGIVTPVVGTFLVLRRLALIADGLGHISFAGVAASLLLGLNPVVGALLVAVAGSVGIERLRARGRVAGDVAIGIYAALGLGLGLILARAAGAANVDLMGFLFGSLVTIGPADVRWIAIVAALTLAVIGFLYKEILSISVDEEAARAAGIPVDRINQALVTLAALTVVVGMRVVGVLLVTTLMVLPVAASMQLARGLGRTILYAAGLGVTAVVAGLTLAYLVDVPAGAMIVVVAAVLYALALGTRRLRDARPILAGSRRA